MKKILVLFAAAAMVLPLAIACEPENKPTKEVVMKAGPTAEDAQLINLTTAQKPTLQRNGETLEIQSIELTEGNRYILVCEPLLVSSQVSTKAGRIEVLIDRFNELTDGGKKFRLQGKYNADIQFQGKKLRVTKDGKTDEYDADSKPSTTSTTAATNAARTWKVDDCFLKITGKLNIESGFKGCDLQEIAKFLQSNNVKIDPSQFAGYKLETMSFTGAGTIAFAFSSAAFYGSYKLNGENISYSFTAISKSDIINASASGTLTFPADKKAVLQVSTTIDGYSGYIEFNLSQAD